MLSKNSLARLAFTVLNTSVSFQSLITLTYGSTVPQDGKEVKMHLHHFLITSIRMFGDHSYVWFLEFQERQAPHVHILTTLPEPDKLGRVEFALAWVNIVGAPTREERENMFLVHAHTRARHKAWEALREKDGAKRYALKYALKSKQKDVPEQYKNVGRFWGTSRDVPPQELKRVPITEEELRTALRNMGNPVSEWPVLPKQILDRS